MFYLVVADKVELVKAMAGLLCGGSYLSLESYPGGLGRFKGEIEAIPGLGYDETICLRRNTTVPRLDFMTIPLEPDTVHLVLGLLPRIGIVRNVLHVQIERGGELQFWAYDNFHPDCVGAGSQVSGEFLRSLVARGVLRGYTSDPGAADRES